jgi:F0F1-type ATP synthase membrane subunit c/vacuolar-type H+-ATPase subunit K
MDKSLLALAAALAIGLSHLNRMGPVENRLRRSRRNRRETDGRAFILLAIPETMVILGFTRP